MDKLRTGTSTETLFALIMYREIGHALSPPEAEATKGLQLKYFSFLLYFFLKILGKKKKKNSKLPKRDTASMPREVVFAHGFEFELHLDTSSFSVILLSSPAAPG